MNGVFEERCGTPSLLDLQDVQLCSLCHRLGTSMYVKLPINAFEVRLDSTDRNNELLCNLPG